MPALLADPRVRLPLVTMAVIALVILGAALANRRPGPYYEPFDETGSWGEFAAFDPHGSGVVSDGAYYMQLPLEMERIWATAERWYGDAVISVDVKQVDGPLRNGHGLIWRADEGAERFYFFVISSDGIFSAGYCVNLCAGSERNMTRGWLSNAALHVGYDVVNTIAVRAEGGRFTFYANGTPILEADDAKFAEGDIGLILETYEEGWPTVVFDNLRVEPLE